MKKWFIRLAGLILIGVVGLAVAAVFFPWRSSRHADYYISRTVISPFPPTLHHVKTIYLFEPSLGEGHCIAAYSITPDDFARLFQARAWASGFVTGNFEAERHFRAAWPAATTKFEAYHITIDESRYVDMAVSTDHARIVFLMSI